MTRMFVALTAGAIVLSVAGCSGAPAAQTDAAAPPTPTKTVAEQTVAEACIGFEQPMEAANTALLDIASANLETLQGSLENSQELLDSSSDMLGSMGDMTEMLQQAQAGEMPSLEDMQGMLGNSQELLASAGEMLESSKGAFDAYASAEGPESVAEVWAELADDFEAYAQTVTNTEIEPLASTAAVELAEMSAALRVLYVDGDGPAADTLSSASQNFNGAFTKLVSACVS